MYIKWVYHLLVKWRLKKGFRRSLCYNPTVYSNYVLGMLLCKDKLQITVQTGWKDQLTF